MSNRTTAVVHKAAGRTLEELQTRHQFDVVHEESPSDPRPLVRILEFLNLMQAMEFVKLFDSGDHDAVWFTERDNAPALFDQKVCLSVVFDAVALPVEGATGDLRDLRAVFARLAEGEEITTEERDAAMNHLARLSTQYHKLS